MSSIGKVVGGIAGGLIGGPAGAAIGSGLGSIVGSKQQESGYGQATAGLTAAQQQYDPFVQGGLEGFDIFQSALTGGMPQGFEDYMQLPSTQYQIQTGVDTATQGLAGMGALNSGAAMRQLQSVGQDVASQGYQQYLNNLSNLSNFGMQGLDAQSGFSRDIADANIYGSQAKSGTSQIIGDVAGNLIGTVGGFF